MENNNPQQTNPPADIPAPAFVPDTMVRQKSHLDKLAEVFLPEDLDSIGNRIIQNVMIPSILKTAGDILVRSIDMIFGTNYSGVNNSQPQQTGNPSNWTTYQQRNTAAAAQPMGTTQIIPLRSGVYDYSDVRFKSVQDAQTVLNNMRAVLQNSGTVSVGMYLQFANASTLPEDFNYGWTNLTKVSLQNTGDREYPYRMILPTPVAIRSQRNDTIYI